MKKLRKYLDMWEAGQIVRGLSVSLEDIRDLQDAYRAIMRNWPFAFLSANVKKVLDKCGIKTVEYDVGWMIVQDCR